MVNRWRQSKAPAWALGQEKGLGSRVGGGRDVLAGLGESGVPVQPPAWAAAPQARLLPKHGVGARPESQGFWCSPQVWH